VSAAPRHRVSWLRQNYDKLVLVLILAGLLVSALLLVLRIGRVKQSLIEARWEKPPARPKMVQPIPLSQFDTNRQALANPFQSTTRSNRMLVSELRVSCVGCGKPIPYSAEKCPFCNAKQPPILDASKIDSAGDGIPDVWKKKYGFNPLDPAVANEDSDGDGFSNLEEYRAGTDPLDPNDHPPLGAKLRVLRIGQNPFKLRFQGEATMPNGSVLYQLNLRSLQRTYFAKVGDEVEGFKFVEYKTNSVEGPVVVLEKDHNQIPLTKGKTKTGYEMVADLVFLIDRNTMRVRSGDTIKVRDQEYKIIDMGATSVLIRDVKTGKDLTIGPLSDSEKSALSGGLENPSQPGVAIPGKMPTPR